MFYVYIISLQVINLLLGDSAQLHTVQSHYKNCNLTIPQLDTKTKSNIYVKLFM